MAGEHVRRAGHWGRDGGARPRARGIGDAKAALGHLALAAHACARRRSSRPRRHAPCSPPDLPAPSPRLPTLAAARLALSGDLRFDSFGTRSEGSDAELLDMGTGLGEVYIDGEEHDVGKKTYDMWAHLVSGNRNYDFILFLSKNGLGFNSDRDC